MVLEKVGLNLSKEIIAWTRTSGSKSLLAMKPKKINTEGLRLAPQLECDTVQISKQVNHGIKFNSKEYSEIDRTSFSCLLRERPWIKSLKTTDDDFYSYADLFLGHCGGFTPNEVVNTYLRTGKIHPDWSKAEIDEIITSAHYAMSKSSLHKNSILYRYVTDINYIPEAGETFIEKGFLSTGINPEYLGGYGKKLVKIYVPKGVPCIANGSYFEVLLKEGCEFEVLEKSDNFATLLYKNSKLKDHSTISKIENYENNVILHSDKWIEKHVKC